MRNRCRWMLFVLAAVAVVLTGVPASGAALQAADEGVCPAAQQCLELLRDGIRLIESGRWRAASVLLAEVAAGLEGRPSHVRDLALAYVYLGVARLQVADADEARQWFAEAQMRDPTLQLDPGEFPGDVLALWEEARDLGTLFVDTEPSGAEVSVDGVARGRSPVGVAGLKPGEYRVTLGHDGYSGVSRVLAVAAGRTERLLVSLVPLGAEARSPGVAPLTGMPDPVSTTVGLSLGDGGEEQREEQAPLNLVPIPDRFPVGTAKKSGRSVWRTVAGVVGVAGGVAMMIQSAQCRGGGKRSTAWLGYGETVQLKNFNMGRQVEVLGGRLDTFGFRARDRVVCEGLDYQWYWERPDGLGFEGSVEDHASVKSGTYNPWLYVRKPIEVEELVGQMSQDPSVVPRLRQALVQSVGDIGVGRRVPKEYLVAGGAMIVAGALFATLWSDVTVVEDLAVDITPSGGVLASRSFGW